MSLPATTLLPIASMRAKPNKKEKIDLLRYSELMIESGIAYGKNIDKNRDKNEYRNLYKIEYKLNYKDYEAGIKVSDRFNEKKEIAKVIKAIKSEYYNNEHDQQTRQDAINAIIALEKLYQSTKE